MDVATSDGIRQDRVPDPPVFVRRIPWAADDRRDIDELVRREWLIANGLGGYASGTIVGAITRRFHGLLIASLPAPLGRCMLLTHLSERVRFPDGQVEWLGLHGQEGRVAQAEGARHLREFRLEAGLPVWRYEVAGCAIEKTIVMPHGQNTVHITYSLDSPAPPLRLVLRPLVSFRPHEAPVDRAPIEGYTLTAKDRRFEITGDPALPPLRLLLQAGSGAFTVDDQAIADVRYLFEQHRGYENEGPLWSPGYFRVQLEPDQPITLIASTESWDTLGAVSPHDVLLAERRRRARLVSLAHPAARTGAGPELVVAADQFIVSPASRTDDQARAQAHGTDARTVIAGYHWFTDWGRDTMISLEGLTLITGRHQEAAAILRTFALHMREGLIPNLFPEGEREGLYHTADATLWFFHAVHRYFVHTGDRDLVNELLPALEEAVRWHLEGTRFGIRVDPDDGLLTQGEPGYQLTWMDAKVGDWVVTPRRGKAVEINALWYNALRLLEGWLGESGRHEAAGRIASHADRTRTSFNRRFWNERTGYLFDVVDGEGGDDPACRPNQIFAIALTHPVLARERWEPVFEAVRRELLTPVGLRSLSPRHPDYKPRYFGDLRTRDAAYHQGTVWSWLMGPFIDAWLAIRPDDRAGAAAALDGLVAHLGDGCVGSISEIFDAEPPFTPRGCVAQAWSVAEALRALVRTSVPA